MVIGNVINAASAKALTATFPLSRGLFQSLAST